MTTPQQPELARSKRSPASPRSAKQNARTTLPAEAQGAGPIPTDNQPGNHPAVEQDKPTTPPLAYRQHRFPFRKDGVVGMASRAFGVTDGNAYVDVDDERLEIRYGPWVVDTPLENIEAVERTGPYQWWKVAGPPHVSFRDAGITFATSTSDGICLRFREPVRAVPLVPLRHPAATVTVEDPDALIRAIEQASSS
jgi:hypothetical protein